MKRYYLQDIFLLFILSALYLWPFFENSTFESIPIFFSIFLSSLLCYLIFNMLFKFERLPAIFGAIVFVFSGLEILPVFSVNKSLYCGIFPLLLAILGFKGMKRKAWPLAAITVIFATLYIMSKIQLFSGFSAIILWIVQSKIVVNFSFAALSAIGIDYFFNDNEVILTKRYETIQNVLRKIVMGIILVMFAFYVLLIYGGNEKIIMNIVNNFAWVTLFSILALVIVYLRARWYRLDIKLYIFILTIIDIFTFWQKRFNL